MAEELPPPPADPPLPPKVPKPDLKTLREQYAEQIKDAKTFEPQGLTREEGKRYLDSEQGAQLLQELSAADPKASFSQVYERGLGMVRSGSDIPELRKISSPLVKIVPQGASVTPYSPYFTTMEHLDEAIASGKGLDEYLALPITSSAPTYDIYQISPLTQVDSPAVFVNKVAPTSELGGLVQHVGGATQYIVPNRSLWGSPIKIGSIGN
ncbi:hypothetical protein [Nitrospirillum amazonense]|uniref:hypothetical protein n=1 Tax=Nitrospirillum amazonense TaxID=28077 RepID=UPI0024123BED|nr:hypothetical protein [Nitrospirillum amazonense]MDG3443700.1 hypothetical protein [Nitrospirillum amazonense]